MFYNSANSSSHPQCDSPLSQTLAHRFLFSTWVREVIENPVLDLISNRSKNLNFLPLTSLNLRRVTKPMLYESLSFRQGLTDYRRSPYHAGRRTKRTRQRWCASADSHNEIDVSPSELVYALRCLPRDVYPNLSHYLDGEGMNFRGSCPCAECLILVTVKVSEQTLSHLGPG